MQSDFTLNFCSQKICDENLSCKPHHYQKTCKPRDRKVSYVHEKNIYYYIVLNESKRY